jgi:hypothetical protein
MTSYRTILCLTVCVMAGVMLSEAVAGEPLGNSLDVSHDLPIMKKAVGTGFANAGWKYDRYSDLPSLDAGKPMIVADLVGPGIIRHIHTTRHHKPELTARGIVLEIYYDDAAEPAVSCPLADFFGDGCNGKSMYFSSPYIECAPWSYNCYFPMPFAKRAKVILRNDTPQDVMNYSYVEWEPLDAWNEQLAYFHATWRRSSFQLTSSTKETFFEVLGKGHLIGRQMSVVTDEPLFRGFGFVMEGNNEVDIDGRERALDYLGTEDSFTFSWGFQSQFAGLRAGMPFISTGPPDMLSIYRFHDHMPIRFDQSLTWSINWQHEKFFTGKPEWAERAQKGGCWVDYATVFYWYQGSPAVFAHEPLPPLDKRSLPMLHSNLADADVNQLIGTAQLDGQLANTFDSAQDLDRLVIAGCYEATHPFWIGEPTRTGGHPGNPNPGKRGILAVHARGPASPCHVVRKVALPAEQPCVLRLVVSGDPYELPGESDFVLEVGIHDGQQVRWFPPKTVEAGQPASEENWRTIEYGLEEYSGATVSIIVKVSYGGKNAAMNEEAFFDEISVYPSG